MPDTKETELTAESGDKISVDGVEFTLLYISRRTLGVKVRSVGTPELSRPIGGVSFPRESAREEMEARK